MRMSASAILVGLSLVSASLAAETPPQFTANPTAIRAGEKVAIAFAASRETDVAVYVLDARSKVVRHLAAGALGAKAPAPLKPGLAQSIEWDGKDDAGKPASGGPFKVRVALGLTPVFDRMIGYNPAALGDVRGLAAGPDGTIYVFSTYSGFATGGSHGTVLAFDRNGKYLRQVVPYPSNLSDEKLKGLKRLEIAPGVRVPFVYNAETRGLVPGLGGENGMFRGVVAKDGRLALSGVMAISRDRGETVQMVVVNTDGSTPPGGVLGPVLGTGTRQPASLALSPDEKTIYATGMRDTPWADKGKFLATVFACGWADKQVKPFITTGLSEPRSAAVDKDGNIYVADHDNNRIAVFRPDGSALGELAVDRPERVEVHPKTGAVYVLGGEKVNELAKFASWKDANAVARATLPTFKHRLYTCMMALDASQDPAVLWFGSLQGFYARFALLRIEDKGNAFGDAVDVVKLPENSKPTAARATDLILAGDLLMVWPQRGGPFASFNARTGQSQKPPWPVPRVDLGAGFILSPGPDGNFYLMRGYPSAGVQRFDAAMKPLPFADGKDGAIADLGWPRTRLRGMCVDARGNVYALRQRSDFPASDAGDAPYADANALGLYGPDGKAINDKLVDSDIRNLSSVRVDSAGNIYLALGAHPGTEMVPANLKGQVPDGRKDPDAERGHNYYPLMYGSIVKFAPAGGAIRLKGDGEAANFAYDRKLFVTGAQWMFFGASIVPAWVHYGSFKPNICACESSRFDVDGFGRSFFGDACGFRVGVLDTGGNLLCWFGHYGNQDSAGPGSAIPTPEIPIGWVHAVAVNDEAAFVGDRLCQRVLRVRLDYAAEAVCDVN